MRSRRLVGAGRTSSRKRVDRNPYIALMDENLQDKREPGVGIFESLKWFVVQLARNRRPSGIDVIEDRSGTLELLFANVFPRFVIQVAIRRAFGQKCRATVLPDRFLAFDFGLDELDDTSEPPLYDPGLERRSPRDGDGLYPIDR